MRIAIIADRHGGRMGGNSKVVSHIASALKRHEVKVMFISPENYLSRNLRKWEALLRILYLYKVAAKTNVSDFDLIVTLQPDSHCVRHHNHIIYFQHHLKQYYDLYRQTLLSKKGLRKKIIFMLLTFSARTADKIFLTPNMRKSHVTVNSEVVGRRIAKYNGISNSTVIYPGCDLPDINACHVPRQQLNDPPVALSFSRLHVAQKGIDLILKTASLLPSCRFIIAGPTDHSILNVEQSKIGKNVQIIDKDFSDNERDSLYAGCDVFLAPYVEEDFGIAPIEANAFGKPVVYCEDSGGVVFTQNHKETGFMCKRKPKDFAGGILYCIEHAQNFQSACIRNAAKYSWQNFENAFAMYVQENVGEMKSDPKS